MLTIPASASGKQLAPALLAALTTLAGSIEALVEAHAHHVIGVTLETPDVAKRERDDDAARTNCESALMLVHQLLLDGQPE